MKRSTHLDRTAAWAAKQNTTGFKTKTHISKADLLRHKALESSLKKVEKIDIINETPIISKETNTQD